MTHVVLRAASTAGFAFLLVCCMAVLAAGTAPEQAEPGKTVEPPSIDQVLESGAPVDAEEIEEPDLAEQPLSNVARRPTGIVIWKVWPPLVPVHQDLPS